MMHGAGEDRVKELDKETIHAVDRLLDEGGEYTPLDLLLAEGRLFYDDYQAWRNGEAAELESRLFGDPAEIGRMLQEAASYAEARGLVGEPRAYACWGDRDKALRFSADSRRDALFHRRFAKPQDRMQFDLFLDNGGSALVNDITKALCDRDGASARALLEKLLDVDPGNAHLGGLERLALAMDEADAPTDPAAALARLEKELIPLIDDLLGPAGRDYAALFWQGLEKRLADRPFDEASPKLHLSYCALRNGDWRKVMQTLEAEPDWSSSVTLRQRHALAAQHLHDEPTLLRDWFLLCFRFGEAAEQLVEQLAPQWRAWWENFLDAEPELPPGEFPAWLLIQRPALAGVISFSSEERQQLPPTFDTLLQLGRAKDPLGDEGMALRRKLKGQSEPLFEHLLAR